MIYQNNHQLRNWLESDHSPSLAALSQFEFDDDAFKSECDRLALLHHAMQPAQVAVRAAYHLLMGDKHEILSAPKTPLTKAQKRMVRIRSLRMNLELMFWLRILWAILALLLLGAIAVRAEPPPDDLRAVRNAFGLPSPVPQSSIVIQLSNQGSMLATRGGGLVNFDCGSGMSCSFSGVTFTMTATGGGGGGCTPPGTSGAFLVDLTMGACGDFAGFSASAHNFVTGLSASGVFAQAQPACGDLSDSGTACQAVAPANTTSTTHQFFNSYTSATGAFGKSQPACTDLSDSGTGCAAVAPANTTATTHQFFTAYTAATGAFTKAQPACGDLSDSAGGCSMSTTAGGDLSGTLPSPTVAKVNGNTPGGTCTNQFVTAIDSSARPTCTTDVLASAQHANQGTTTTVLHGAAAGNPSFGSVVSADMNITTTSCTNQVVSAISAGGVGTCHTVVGGDMASATVTATQLAVQYSKRACTFGLGDGTNAIASATYPSSGATLACVNNSGVTWTVTGVHCFTDNAGSSTLAVSNNAGTALLTGAVTCNATKTSGGAAGTQSATTTIATTDGLNFVFVADGTSKYVTATVDFTY